MNKTIKILKKACKFYDQGEVLQLTTQDIDELKLELKTYPESLSLGTMNDGLYDYLKSRASEFNDLIDRYKNERGQKVQHTLTRGSLTRVDIKQATKWLKTFNKAIVASKLDGMSIILKYRSGKFVQAITRGDGFIGSDCTRHFINSKIIPQTIIDDTELREIEIRGELCVPKYNHEQLKLLAKEIYNKTVSSARNIVVGVVNGIEPQPQLFELFKFNAFEFSHHKTRGYVEWGKASELFELAAMGFDIVKHEQYLASNLAIDNCRLLKVRCEQAIKHEDFECDGIVIYNADNNIVDEYLTNSINPKFARKFKEVENVSGQWTTIRDVEWRLSDKGRWNAVAVFDEIVFDGVRVKKATLNNMDFIEKLNLGIGSKIEVIRGGGVIPKIISSNNIKDFDFKLPDKFERRGAFLWDIRG